MESRHRLYYQGNTVIPPNPGRKRLKKNRNVKIGRIIPAYRNIKYEPKTCASYKCIWCDYEAQKDKPIIICPRCRNCQYCGLQQGSGYDHECIKCGNRISKNSTQID